MAEADRGEFVEFNAEDVIAERRAALASKEAKKLLAKTTKLIR